jgi:hypothetical protein
MGAQQNSSDLLVDFAVGLVVTLKKSCDLLLSSLFLVLSDKACKLEIFFCRVPKE